MTCAIDRDYEHVAFLSCPQKVWCRKECNKEMHQNKRVESSRCAQIKGHRFHSNNPACCHLSTTSALGILLTPGAAFATLLLRALLEQLLLQNNDIGRSQSGLECATCVGTTAA